MTEAEFGHAAMIFIAIWVMAVTAVIGSLPFIALWQDRKEKKRAAESRGA